MNGKRLLRSLSLKNILSFGPEGVDIELQPLNVLIGPNGSGKSNFLEAIRLLQAAPRDLTQPISKGGGINEWLWKGEQNVSTATVSYEVEYRTYPLHHELELMANRERLAIKQEVVTLVHEDLSPLAYLYTYTDGKASALTSAEDNLASKFIDLSDIKPNQSILAQRTDPDVFYELWYMNQKYSDVQLYAETRFGRLMPARQPQAADLDASFLYEDGSNLALVLNDLDSRPGVMRRIVEYLKLFYERAESIKTRVSFGTVQVYIEEKGLEQLIPATRLSDGTLRFLCLLTILLHPEPPPLVCIEEPELGMHPDVLGTIADLLKEATTRTQLIITTHSDTLVSHLSDVPECLIVCDRGENGTTMRHLKPDELGGFPETDMLGDIWMKGAIGGTRW